MVSVTEKVKTLFFSARFPPGPHLRSRLPPIKRQTRHKTGGKHPSGWGPGPQASGGPGPKPLEVGHKFLGARPPSPVTWLVAPTNYLGLIDFLSPRHPKLGAGRPACSCKPGFLHRLFPCAQSRLKISCQS